MQYYEFSELVNLDLVGTWVSRITGSYSRRSELLLNFCMLLPLGILFPWTTKKRIGATVLVGCGLIIVIELAQLLTKRGWFELSDIVDNTIGVIIGYALYRIGDAVWRRKIC